MKTEKEIQELVFQRLRQDSQRYVHTLGVVKKAAELALCHHADDAKARIAAWCHDATKGMDPFKEASWIHSHFPEVLLKEWPQPTRHALTAVVFAKVECQITDNEILSAIRYHTTGRPAMSPIEKILFVADFIEESRTFVTDQERELAKIDLDLAVLDSLETTIDYLQKADLPVAILSMETREYYRKLKGGSG